MNRVAIIGLAGTSVFLRVPRFHSGGETVHADSLHVEYGGKGFNQAVAAARHGAKVSFLTAVGASDADPVRDLLEDEGVACRAVVPGGESAYAVILTDAAGANQVTVFPGPRLTPENVDDFASEVASADILLLTNEVPEEVNVRAAKIAVDGGTRVILNPAPARPIPDALAQCVSLYTPNEFETDGIPDGAEAVVTLGAAGCLIRRTGWRIPAKSYGPAIDTTGAGDTFSGVLAAFLSRGLPLEEAAKAATDAAARSVTKPYVLSSIPRWPLSPM